MVKNKSLSIRNINKDDLEWVRALHNDPEVLRMLTDPHVVTAEEQIKWFESISKSKTTQRIILEVDGTAVGVFRVDQIDYNNKSVCLGLDIHKDHRGRGYAKSGYYMVMNKWFFTEGFNRVWLMVAAYNSKARNLYKDLGFKEEGAHRQGLYKNGEYHDCIVMGILKNEYISKDTK